jgi:hypothetical protein
MGSLSGTSKRRTLSAPEPAAKEVGHVFIKFVGLGLLFRSGEAGGSHAAVHVLLFLLCRFQNLCYSCQWIVVLLIGGFCDIPGMNITDSRRHSS